MQKTARALCRQRHLVATDLEVPAGGHRIIGIGREIEQKLFKLGAGNADRHRPCRRR